MKVKYFWSEDGEMEWCDRYDGVASEEGVCYHCDSKIEKGNEITLLKVLTDKEEYLLHKSCADKSCY